MNVSLIGGLLLSAPLVMFQVWRFAAPMIGLYLLSIGIAWLVGRRRGKDESIRNDSHLKLVFAVTVLDQAWRQRGRLRASLRGRRRISI